MTSDATTRTTHSATLAIDEAVQARRRAGQDVLHLGFGQAGLPVPPGLTDVLAGAARLNQYAPVAGTGEARAAAAGWFTRRDLPTGPDQLLFAPGSKPLLFALLAAIGGDVVLPCPSWVSYAAQAALLGRRVVPVPIPAAGGGIPDPDLLEPAIDRAVRDGADPRVLILTVPDNPTGTIAPADQVDAVCAVAERRGLTVISDEIYADLSPTGAVPRPAHRLPDRTVVTSGLSKSLALGGWRIGFARTPDNAWGRRLREDLTGVASEIWSCLATPMLVVAAHALADPPEITSRVAASRRLHVRVATAVHECLTAAGADCRAPQAGFYLYPDFGPARAVLADQGVATGSDLAAALLDRFGIATLPGAAFGEPDTTLALRLATGLLYGSTDAERTAALHADAPETLPSVSAALTRLDAALTALTG